MTAPVAVIGLACRFPGAADAAQLWRLLCSGSDAITRGPGDRPTRVAAYGTLDDGHAFDGAFFGYSRADAARIDAQQRVFLEVAAQAIDNAAIDPTRPGHRIGVFAGSDPPHPSEADETYWDKDFLTSRVAYKLGLTGPAMTVQSGCSTSLSAVHVACQSLRSGECDIAVAGGVRIAEDSTGYPYLAGGILAPDGYCRPFDHAAAGTVPGEGAGAVVLCPLNDALAAGYEIDAVIRGSACTNDGSHRVGFTAPSPRGQAESVRAAQRLAGVTPEEIGYIEAHGTGTQLGDPIEVEALAAVFHDLPAGEHCALGSVKGHLGHTGCASGIASLIKTILMLRHGQLVPTANFTAPNRLLHLDRTPFFIPTTAQPWTTPRLAGVTSIGMGGTNVHAIVSGPVDRPAPSAPTASATRILTLSTPAADTLPRYRREIADAPNTAATPNSTATTGFSPEDLADTAWTLAAGRRDHPWRTAVVARTPDEAEHALSGAVEPVRATDRPKAVLLFPGQGSWRPEAVRLACERLPAVAEVYDAASALVREQFGIDLADGGPDAPNTVTEQVGLLALGYGLAVQLRNWGARPVAALGSSLGEYTAATAAGLWTLEDALEIVARRAMAMAACPPGAMLAVRRAAAELGPFPPEVSLAIDGVDLAVVSGPEHEIEQYRKLLEHHGIRSKPLATALAFHAPAMRAAAAELERVIRAAPTGRLHFPVLSNRDGGPLSDERARQPGYWVEQMLGTVRLADNVGQLLSRGDRLFLELGPGAALSGALRRHPDWQADNRVIALPGSGNEHDLARSIADLWQVGAHVEPTVLAGPGPYRLRHLPGPPFTRTAQAAAVEPVAAERTSPASPTFTWPGTGGGSSAAAGPRGEHGSLQQPGTTSSTGTGPETQGSALETIATAAALGLPTADNSESPTHERLSIATQFDHTDTVARTVLNAWHESLGVDTFEPDDDYYRLGGDSLGVLHLLDRLATELEITIPVEDFTAHPTLGNLVELARATAVPVTSHHEPITRPVVLTTGSRTPIFFVPALTGGPLAYARIAAALPDRACFGLRPPDRSTSPVRGLADLATYYLAQLDTTAEFVLAGWSLGATVAHELTRQANLLGIHPERLIMIDGHPARFGLPGLLSPEHLAVALPGLRELRAARRGRKLDARNRTGLSSPQEAAAATADLTALLRYHPRPVPVPTTILRAGRTAAQCDRLATHLAGLYPGGVQVLPQPGDHYALLTDTGARFIARTIDTVLEQGAAP
ncbi:acyltransferase domain-containing protein [Nocardia panacis]|uniref:Acyltransferase domain-containing protein n=1 Tax=Nocardia panacis TaxID=2340916 RepID=A0A3A4JP14_9NOCA|nr:type I polyketide synthase [Nocardia panacis]RJO70728.1 acyltransferase domain-containing protein [Nocardia panacis]